MKDLLLSDSPLLSNYFPGAWNYYFLHWIALQLVHLFSETTWFELISFSAGLFLLLKLWGGGRGQIWTLVETDVLLLKGDISSLDVKLRIILIHIAYYLNDYFNPKVCLSFQHLCGVSHFPVSILHCHILKSNQEKMLDMCSEWKIR